jgi:serine protease Do
VLNPIGPKDPISMHPARFHSVKLTAGRTYAIDLKSNQFDAFLRLQLRGQQVAQDDDGGGNFNARIVFPVTETASYRIVVTTFNGKTGAYTLTVQELGG